MKLSRFITAEQWDALFDQLDVDKNGFLTYSEFLAKAAIKNSFNLTEALNQFDVLSSISSIISSMTKNV